MEKRWVPKKAAEKAIIEQLTESLNITPVLAGILAQRGIHNFEQAKRYFRPKLSQLHDPFLMKDMHHAVSRLQRAIQNQEKILIYGDYDVDGTTSVALVFGFLKPLFNEIDFYIPDRYSEGYGISEKAITWAGEENFSLIISLDCGIRAVNLIGEARKKGIDFIVCDHHRPGDELPPAYAILDTKQPGCAYPYKELPGCAVGFKLMQGLCEKAHLDTRYLYEFLDLVAVSIASDIVPITGENRILEFYGLEKLSHSPRPGLEMLMEVAGLTTPLNVHSVVFGIGPRINAAGRIEHAKAAVNLLLAEDREEALQYASNLNKRNAERKGFDKKITQEALAMIEEDEQIKNAKTTVLFKNDWHKGVIGIVASRCIEKYYRPTIILTESNNKATGSARSVVGFDVYEAIQECADLLEQFGGHTYAAGLTLSVDNVPAFQQKFEEVVTSRISEDLLIPQIDIDQVLQLEDITPKFFKILKQMAPFGPQNMQPVFVVENLLVEGEAQILKEEHLKFNVKQPASNAAFTAIAFGMVEKLSMINQNQPFQMAFTIEENHFNGRTTLQLMVKDIKAM